MLTFRESPYRQLQLWTHPSSQPLAFNSVIEVLDAKPVEGERIWACEGKGIKVE